MQNIKLTVDEVIFFLDGPLLSLQQTFLNGQDYQGQREYLVKCCEKMFDKHADQLRRPQWYIESTVTGAMMELEMQFAKYL